MTASTALATKQQIRRKRNWLNFGLGAWSVLIYVFMFAPIAFVVAHSFTRSSAFEVWAGPPTLKWFHRLWNNDLLVSAVGNSLKAGLGSTIIATIIGSMAGITLARRAGKWSKYFLGLVFLILVTPEIVDAIGLFVWFVKLEQTLHLKNTILTLRGDSLLPFYIGQSLFSAAVVTLIVRARMQGLDESLEEAAADLYATPRKAFFQVTLPLVAPAILASALLAFTLSLDNTIVSQFVAPAGKPTYPVYVFSATKQILKPDIAAASTMLLGLTLTALGLVVLVLKRAGDSSSDIAATITGAG